MTEGAASHVDQLEHLAARAWPAPVREDVDGWEVRHGGGVTRRANSVFARRYAGDDPERSIDAVERLYAAWSLPSRFQLAPGTAPRDLDGRLASRGYIAEAESIVMRASLEGVAALPVRHDVSLSSSADREWANTWWTFDRGDAAPRGLLAILHGTHGSTAYATVTDGGAVVALGRGSIEESWLGIFMMATHPNHRRRGLATSLLGALVAWAAAEGATDAYLQVEAGNTSARRLYEGAGFAEAYRYHYRSKPTPR